MQQQPCHIIMPVKDSIESTTEAIQAIINNGYTLTVYNDNSTPENTKALMVLSQNLHFELIHIADITTHPSPNYRYILIDSREKALKTNLPLVIIESDVIIQSDTIERLCAHQQEGIGMVAAVTVDTQGTVNFPYEYARSWRKDAIDTKKRFSFCCTLLTIPFLQALDFDHLLDPTKNWYDVTISHESVKLGFHNILLTDTSVTHKPHSSRPWKQLKYTHPLLYYWRKITQHQDKI